MDFAGDDRALASGIIIFIAILIVAGLLFIALDSAASDVFSAASGYTSDTDAQDHVDLMKTIWGGILVYATFVGLLFLIAKSVLESRRPG